MNHHNRYNNTTGATHNHARYNNTTPMNHYSKYNNNYIASSDTRNDYKREYVKHIYNNINLSYYKYEIIKLKSDLPKLLEKKFFVSPNYSGNNCLLVFAKINNKFCAYTLERRTLHYNVNYIKFDDIKLNFVDVALDVNIYAGSGSIFDGIFVTINNQKIFIITDVFLFKGQSMLHSKLDNKFQQLNTYLDINYKKDKNDTLTLQVNDLTEIDNIKHLIKDKIPKINDFLVKGVCFYPEISGNKLIYTFNVNNHNNNRNFTPNIQQKNNVRFERTNTNNTHNNHNIDNLELLIKNYEKKLIEQKQTIYSPKDKDHKYVFEMKITNTIDVYNLFIIEKTKEVSDSNKKLLKRINVGVAYIPTLAKSKWCNNLMNENNGSVLVHCNYIEHKQKWEPVEISTSKKPSYITDFNVS